MNGYEDYNHDMEIKLCDSCKGEGEVKEYDFRGYLTHKCSRCNGTGRIKFKGYTWEVPFDHPEEDLLKADTEIFEILRRL